MSEENAVYSTDIIIEPRWGIARRSSLRSCTVFKTRLVVGDTSIPLDSISTLRVEGGCIVIHCGDGEIRFAVRARYGPGKIATRRTIWLKEAISCLRKGDQESAREWVAKLRRHDRNDALMIGIMVVYVVGLGCTFGKVFHLSGANPMLLFFFPAALILGSVGISIFFRWLNRRIA